MSLSLVQGLLSEVGLAPSAASVEHVNGPTLPIISRSYVDTEFHGSLNSPVVNFADSNESLHDLFPFTCSPCSPFSTHFAAEYSVTRSSGSSLPFISVLSHPTTAARSSARPRW